MRVGDGRAPLSIEPGVDAARSVEWESEFPADREADGSHVLVSVVVERLHAQAGESGCLLAPDMSGRGRMWGCGWTSALTTPFRGTCSIDMSSPFRGRRGHEEDQHGDTECLRYAVRFKDGQVRQFATYQATHLGAGNPARVGQASDRVGNPRPGCSITLQRVGRSMSR